MKDGFPMHFPILPQSVISNGDIVEDKIDSSVIILSHCSWFKIIPSHPPIPSSHPILQSHPPILAQSQGSRCWTRWCKGQNPSPRPWLAQTHSGSLQSRCVSERRAAFRSTTCPSWPIFPAQLVSCRLRVPCGKRRMRTT